MTLLPKIHHIRKRMSISTNIHFKIIHLSSWQWSAVKCKNPICITVMWKISQVNNTTVNIMVKSRVNAKSVNFGITYNAAA